MFTRSYILLLLNPVLETKLDFLRVHSMFLPARASLWPERSGTTTYTLIALLYAVLLRRLNRVAT